IVPWSDRARLIDAFLVTPVRIFVWFVFLGTAYELVIQKVLEDFKMSKLQQQLTGHILVCGYGVTGRIAAKEMVARGSAPNKIVVIDIAEHNLRLAAESGFVGLRGDAASEEMMRLANVGKAKVVIVSPGRDDTSALIVLTVRNINPGVKIVASVYEEENFKLIRQAGANVIVSSARVGGFLLADAVENWHIAEYVLDLLTADGRVSLVERPAKDDEIGRNALEVADGLLVRIFRSGEKIGFWEKDKLTIKAGDILLVIVHNVTGAEASQQA
ncbi:MAG: NAD-binding protein, partial [Burkholderiales bacterium]|nr:NAD-binding protein [Burkholderiales bacterium]